MSNATATPNPLPCGCRAVWCNDPADYDYDRIHVQHCPLHATAADLLAASIEVMNAVDGPAGSMRRFRDGQKRMLAAIAKATGEPEPRVGYIASEIEQARGRLQDAAPDLLAACEAALAVWEPTPEQRDALAESAPQVLETYGALSAMLRAAIAKAKGAKS